MTVMTLLPIDRTVFGAELAQRYFQACRYAAMRLDPSCQILAHYEEHERVGWRFEIKDRPTADRLHACFGRMQEGKAWADLLP